LNAVAYVPYYWLERLSGTIASRMDVPGPKMLIDAVGIVPMPSTFLLGRGLSTAFSIATVALVFLIGRRITGRTAVGLIAALLYACSSTAVEHSHYITPDTITAFFCALCLYASVLLLQRGDRASYVFAAVAGGLAASTKYNAAIVLLLVPLAACLHGARRALKNPFFYAAPVIAILAFLAGTPFSLLDFKEFLADLTKEAHHYSTGHLGMEGNAPSWYANWVYAETGYGIWFVLWGAIEAIRAKSRPYLLLIAFPLVYLIFISSFVVRNSRTALPLLAGLFVLEAWGLVKAWDRVQSSPLHRVGRAVCALGFVAFLALVPGWAIAAAFRKGDPDTRDLARVWITSNVAQGSKLAIEPYSPYVDPQRYRVRASMNVRKKPFAWYKKAHFDYVVLTDGIVADDLRYTKSPPTKVFVGAGPEVRIYEARPH
jgi:4-amino-4-deoxy-L-arabinose transferase-like glycosyltransferase